MIFATKIAGVPCKCEVIYHRAKQPVSLIITGAWNPEPAPIVDVEYRIYDLEGHRAPWLAKLATQDDDYRLQDEYQAAFLAHKYGIAY